MSSVGPYRFSTTELGAAVIRQGPTGPSRVIGAATCAQVGGPSSGSVFFPERPFLYATLNISSTTISKVSISGGFCSPNAVFLGRAGGVGDLVVSCVVN